MRAEGERGDRVNHVGHWLKMLGEHLQPAGHRADRHVCAGDEHQRNTIIPHALRGLGIAGEQPHGDEQPLEGKPERDHEPNAARPSSAEPCRLNPTANAIAAVNAVLHATSAVSASARAQHRGARDRQRAQPVDESVLEILGHRGRGPHPWRTARRWRGIRARDSRRSAFQQCGSPRRTCSDRSGRTATSGSWPARSARGVRI